MCLFGRSSEPAQPRPTPAAPVRRPDSNLTATFRRRNRQARGTMDNIFTSPLGIRGTDGSAAPSLATATAAPA